MIRIRIRIEVYLMRIRIRIASLERMVQLFYSARLTAYTLKA